MFVKSVTPIGKKPVFNMEVKETHDFAVENGTIIHNCYDALRYILTASPMPGTEPRDVPKSNFNPFHRY